MIHLFRYLEKLEFRSKIAELSAVLADSLGVPTAAKLYEDESQSHAWSLEQGDTEYLNGPDNSKLKPEPESSPSESVHQPDNDADAETAPKVGYTGKMLTRKEIPPCGLVACIPPIMITCYNTSEWTSTDNITNNKIFSLRLQNFRRFNSQFFFYIITT